MTTPDDPQVPIVPGQPYEPPTEPFPTTPPQVSYQPPAQPAPPQQAWNPQRIAGNTVVVIMTIIGIFCGIPLALCAFVGCASAFTGNRQRLLDPEVEERVRGKRVADVRAALAALVDEGFVSVAKGPNNSKIHTLIKPFGEEES